jgi:peptidoglycan-associated lipoprotein
VEEVEEPWEAEPVVNEEPLPVNVLQSRANELNQQEVLGDIFFAFDKDDLSEEARDRLASHARWLRSNPEFGLLIEGHCDERDTEEYNLALGERRANAARDYLVLLGIDPGRLQTISYGEERPVDPGHTEAAWSKNRRGHFVIQVLEGAGN